jgi:hypothetical protein
VPAPQNRGFKKKNPKVGYTVHLEVRLSPILLSSIREIAAQERKPLTAILAPIILLGCGVWRRLKERPEILKDRELGHKSELLLLADLQFVQTIKELQEEVAAEIIERDRLRREKETNES